MRTTFTYDALVIGATGFIGNHMLHTLLEAGKSVRVLVRSVTKAKMLVGLPVDIVYGSLEESTIVESAAKGCCIIYNCAGLSSDWAADRHFEDANIRGVENVLNALEKSQAKRLIHVSTSDVYGYPKQAVQEDDKLHNIGLPYNRSKIEGENLIWRAVKDKKLPVTVFRPVSVYGPQSMEWVVEIAQLMLKKNMVLLDGGHSNAGLVFVRNLTQVMMLSADYPHAIGQAYNIRDEENHTWKDFIEGLGKCFHTKYWRCSNIPTSIAYPLSYAMEKTYALMRIKSRPLLTRHAVHLLSRDQGYSIDKAKAELGFQSWISFEQGMELTRDWMRSEEGRKRILNGKHPQAVYRLNS